MAGLQPIIVFHGRHFVRHLGICNPIFVTLLYIMSGVILRNFEENDVFLSNCFSEVHKRGIHTQTHTDTHDDSIRRNAMRWISPKNWRFYTNLFVPGAFRDGRTYRHGQTHTLHRNITPFNSIWDWNGVKTFLSSFGTATSDLTMSSFIQLLT